MNTFLMISRANYVLENKTLEYVHTVLYFRTPNPNMLPTIVRTVLEY